MKPEDLKKAPKLFAENIKLGYSSEYFVLGITSGNQGQIFALSPGHAKRLHQYLGEELKNYEAKNGEITAQWNPNVVSPVQRSNPPSDKS